MTHHPHVHMIVPGAAFSLDGTRWITSRPAFLLPVRVLGTLFHRLFRTPLDARNSSREATVRFEADSAIEPTLLGPKTGK